MNNEILFNESYCNFALEFAKKQHSLQKRKFTDDPYIYHPISVANLVNMYTFDYDDNTDLICASYLHDVVEDTNVSINDIFHTFTAYTTVLVDYLTTPHTIKSGYKTAYLAGSMLGMNEDALIIKLCDRYDNILGLGLDIVPDKFKKKYYQETKYIITFISNNRKDLNDIHKDIIENINKHLENLHYENPKIFV